MAQRACGEGGQGAQDDRVDDVEVDAVIQDERAVKFEIHAGGGHHLRRARVAERGSEGAALRVVET